MMALGNPARVPLLPCDRRPAVNPATLPLPSPRPTRGPPLFNLKV
jgi:hypothetical protein